MVVRLVVVVVTSGSVTVVKVVEVVVAVELYPPGCFPEVVVDVELDLSR